MTEARASYAAGFPAEGVSFTVNGAPVPKQSFRYVHGGGYTPAPVKAWQERVGYAARYEYKQEPYRGAVVVRLEFWMPNRRRRDLDNLSKAVLDALNGIVWHDDTQVEALHLYKFVDGDDPRVVVHVRTL
jgi:crossover junction endodeoxyribonuclease RusA